ncbi:hypothetical protein CAEBREN_10406 [Caenorhabditis brenneri]|uniref:Uncharacterized protein n=1 Tax=Caenorhabditis brenneri TaxID=135651 RepID=G0NL06_CAEBE|nr:hypothetical protein CAEBREN_10406 [Caenorhabditis brenneri]
MSLTITGKAAHIAPRRRPSQGPRGKTADQSSRKQSVKQQKQQEEEEEENERERIRKEEIQREIEEQYQAEKLQRKQYVHEFQELQKRRDSLSEKEKRSRRNTTTQILARGNEVSLNGETWCQLPPYHPPIPAIISDRSQYSQRVGRDRSFYDAYPRDRREYSVPCFPRSRHGHSSGMRERSFVMSQTLEREESLMDTLEEAMERNTQLEKEITSTRERELDNEKVINTLSSRIKNIELEKKEEIEAMMNEKKSLLEELLHMQKRIDELAPACAEKELKIVTADNEKHDLSKRLRMANSDISQLQATIMHLREDISAKDNEIKVLNDEVVYVKSRVLVLEGDLQDVRTKDAENQERINGFLQDAKEVELTRHNEKRLVDKVLEENSSLIKENARLATKLSRLESIDFTLKQKELKEAQTNGELVTEMRAALQLEKSSSHSLLNKLEIMRQRCEELEKSILDREKTEDDNIAERSRVEKELNALHALSKSLSAENKLLREEKLTNEEIIDELKGKIRALEMSIRSSQDIYHEKERQNAAKIEELEVEALQKHQKYLQVQEISKTLQQITALLPAKTSSMTQLSQKDCPK